MDISAPELKRRVEKQLCFLTDYEQPFKLDLDIFNEALKKMEISLAESISPQVIRGIDIRFTTTHIGQYACFLYWLARMSSRADSVLAERISYLNTTVNSIWLNHNVDMPEHFYFDHPLGTIIGKAQIGDYFGCAQGCTIGAVSRNRELIFPRLGKHVEMMTGSAIIGDCTIGNNVICGANALIKNRDVPDNSMVFGQDREICIKTLDEKMQNYFSFFNMVDC